MEKSRKVFIAIFSITIVVIAGYFIFGGSLSGISPEDASGSAMDGVKKADKYNSGSSEGEVAMDGDEVQQLLQNDQFQQLIQDDGFRELMKSPEFTALAKNATYLEMAKNPAFEEMQKNANFMTMAKSPQF